jgi:hypothetical protein
MQLVVEVAVFFEGIIRVQQLPTVVANKFSIA